MEEENNENPSMAGWKRALLKLYKGMKEFLSLTENHPEHINMAENNVEDEINTEAENTEVESNNAINYNFNQQNDNDDIAFVVQVQNDDPLVIDLANLSSMQIRQRRPIRSMSQGSRFDRSRSPISTQILQCPICLETYNQPTSTNCGHIFCTSCITRCISKTKKCPICKKDQTRENLRRIYL